MKPRTGLIKTLRCARCAFVASVTGGTLPHPDDPTRTADRLGETCRDHAVWAHGPERQTQ